MFVDSQQKEISTFLTKLWECKVIPLVLCPPLLTSLDDPFKAKWSMLAKVYSIIRDQVGKINAPLGEFLDLACPHIGIIPTDEYLSKLHWHMITIQGKRVLRQFANPNLSEMEDHYKHSNLSEGDILAHCSNHGYMPPSNEVFDNKRDKGQHLMVSLPHFNPTPQKLIFIQEAVRDPMAMAAHIYDLPIDHQFFNTSGPDMVWTGRMTDIYNPNDNSNMFSAGLKNEHYEVLEISDFAQTATYLAQLGPPLPPIQPECKWKMWKF